MGKIRNVEKEKEIRYTNKLLIIVVVNFKNRTSDGRVGVGGGVRRIPRVTPLRVTSR